MNFYIQVMGKNTRALFSYLDASKQAHPFTLFYVPSHLNLLVRAGAIYLFIPQNSAVVFWFKGYGIHSRRRLSYLFTSSHQVAHLLVCLNEIQPYPQTPDTPPLFPG